MKIKHRILIGFIILYCTGLYFLVDFIINDIRPRYLETVEESLNDTAHLLASLIEIESSTPALDTTIIKDLFKKAQARKFSARIFGFTKESFDLDLYVTNNMGIVLYDSRNKENIGKDYSRWNDVYNTLHGKYGARSTRTDESDPSSSMLYVAAPVMKNGAIAGVVTIIKPQDSVTPFINIAQNKFILGGIITGAALIFMSIILTMWFSRPLTRLGNYIKSLKNDESLRPPKFSGPEIQELGSVFVELWDELKGKKYIEQYIQSLTHELKSPLTSIYGSAELLQEDMPEKQKKVFYANILRETRRMESLIEKLLELTELENRNELKNKELLDLKSILNEITDSFSPILIKKSISLKQNLDNNPEIKGEYFLLHHALANIIDNAVKFTPQNGTITIESKKTIDSLVITIINSGPEIPTYAIDKLFNRFYSLPDPETDKKGTGLGLPFVKEAIALHKGQVSIKNGQNCVIAEISLPL